MHDTRTDRRALLGAAGTAAGALLMPRWAMAQTRHQHATHPLPSGTKTARPRPDDDVLTGPDLALSIGALPFTAGGQHAIATCVNGTVPGPLIRLREGQDAHIAVTNTLEVDSSIHWHGLLVPFAMDGVPGLSFPGIAPGQTFHYQFPIKQTGTYWYHSHSGGQEGMGLIGPLVIDPAEGTPADPARAAAREMVLVLSDWSAMRPETMLHKLKTNSDYFNYQQKTLGATPSGRPMSEAERLRWARMRMSPNDISDVTGARYAYLVNGHDRDHPWNGLFHPGESVRLRIINASAMTIYNWRIPGLPMTVIAADGSDVKPVETDEIQIGVAETYDVIVTPEARAYAMVAESIDRSGMAVAMLAPRAGMRAPVPPLRKPPTLTMRDMGMGAMKGMSGMPDMSETGGKTAAKSHMSMRDGANAPGLDLNPGVTMVAPVPVDRMGDRGLGLEDVNHRVLVYTDLESPAPRAQITPPTREIVVYLTGNMERYMWSFDGHKYEHLSKPIRIARDERVRVKLVNETMMTHPIHLHGYLFDLANGKGDRLPRKHTVNVMPGGYAAFDLTADAPGDWAFHCHLLLHMMAGMFNVVSVRPLDGGAA